MAKKKAKPSDRTGPAKDQKSDVPDFESSLANLERIVADLESGQLTLTDSIKRYEEGVGIVRQCHAALDQVEQKIELLTRVNEQGEATTTAFQPPPDNRGASAGEPDDTDPGDQRDSEVDDSSRLF